MLEWVEMAIDRAIEAGIEEALQDEATLKEAVEKAGYVMVQIEPTEAMVNAGLEASEQWKASYDTAELGGGHSVDLQTVIYKAMIGESDVHKGTDNQAD